MEEKIKSLNKKIDELQKKLAKNAKLVDKKSKTAKSEASAKIAELQDNIADAKSKLADRKEAFDAQMLAKYIDDTTDYAESCVELSVAAAEEARLAILEAAAAQQEYDEKYGGK